MKQREIELHEVGAIEPPARFAAPATLEHIEIERDIESLIIIRDLLYEKINSLSEPYLIDRLASYHDKLVNEIAELGLGLELSKLIRITGGKLMAAEKIRSITDELGI